MNVASITPTPIALTPIEAPRARRRFPSPVSAMSVPMDAIQSSSRVRRRSSKPADGPHSVGSAATASATERSSDQAEAVRRAASAAWSRATATRSSVVASRISATGAVEGRKMLAIAPRTAPIPLEKIRVMSSAPT